MSESACTVREQVMGMRSALHRRITPEFESAADESPELKPVRSLVYAAESLVDLALRIVDGDADAPSREQLDVLAIGMWAVGLEDAPSSRTAAVLLRMLADAPEGVR